MLQDDGREQDAVLLERLQAAAVIEFQLEVALATITTGVEFGQPVFADNMLLIPTKGKGLWAYK